MKQTNYRWPRFWYLRDETAPWIENGLLSAFYDSRYYSLQDKGLFELVDLLDVPCLILLGEPGMGKSYSLKDIENQLYDTDDERYRFFNLGDFTSSNHLIEEIFTGNPDFVDWQTSSFALHLFLDGLDEAIVQVKSVTRWIQNNIAKNKQHLPRLFLRITCRTADWPQEFEEDLIRIWGKEFVFAYTLAPLRQTDVYTAVLQAGLDADHFWKEVVDKNAQVFASRPITFKFLLREFDKIRRLPDTRCDLYEQGCRELCREISDSHNRAIRSQPEERFVLAARVAALTIFTGHIGVSDDEFIDGDNKFLAVRDCAGGKEQSGGIDFYVYEEFVRETLDTALFRGGSARQWAHKTYAEFLAAWYVAKNLGLPQINSLIFHPSNRLTPQLEETAAWIASFSDEVFRGILSSDPQVLLRSDVTTGDIEAKSKLTLALLEASQRDLHLDYGRNQLTVLKHPGLATILKSYLENAELYNHVRRFALDIVQECQVTELLDTVVAIALDSNQPLMMRSRAAHCVLDIGGQQHKSQLKPVALLPLDDRYCGDLKRYAILAIWPQGLSAKELFETLVVPSDDTGLIDLYTTEKWVDLILPELKPDDLPHALEWVERLDENHRLGFVFVDLLDAILLSGWQNLEYPGVLDAYAHAVIALWQRHDDVLNLHRTRVIEDSKIDRLTAETMLADKRKRLTLFERLIQLAAPCEKNIVHKFRFDVPLVSYSDVPWLVDKFNQLVNEQEKALIASLIRYVVNEFEAEQFQFIYDIGKANPELWQALNYELYVELQSDKARQERELHLQHLEYQRRQDQRQSEQNRPPLTPSPVERVRRELSKFYEGRIDAWWMMSCWMMSNPDGGVESQYERECNFFTLPVWSQLDAIEQLQIIESAPHYIAGFDPDASRWWEERNSLFWPIVAGCRAFFLLIAYSRIEAITNDLWRKWAPALTYFVYQSLTFPNDESSRKQKESFLQLLRVFAPEEVTETMLWVAESEDSEKHFFLSSRLENLWNAQLAESFLRVIRRDQLSTPNASSLLSGIANHDFSLAKPLLMDWFVTPIPSETEKREKAATACQLLLQYEPDISWPLVWPAFQQDLQFGDQVMRLIARSERFGGVIRAKLMESDLGDLCLWLWKQYPPENDPKRIGSYRVTVEHEIADFRDNILRQLVERGTEQSIQQLNRLQEKTSLDFRRYLHQAEFIMRQHSWKPPSPKELRELFEDKHARWVQDENQLLDVIEELLDQLNVELQHGYMGSLPTAIDLWNEYPHGKLGPEKVKFTPKDEERLSDYVARFLKCKLEERNVFIGRETQISRGNLTDILIETRQQLADGRFGDTLTIVIEVKGCWNSEIKGALSKQLAERYLTAHGLRHGIYLVGRFFCEAWNEEADSSRWQKSSRITDGELKSFLDAQAQELTQKGLHVRVRILRCQLRQHP